MSCREHGGGRLATALARDASGLSDVQVLTTLHRLNREAAALPDLPQPTREEVSRWVEQTIEEALAASPTMSQGRQRRLREWANQISQEELPSPQLFYAWQNLQREARQNQAGLEQVYNDLAQQLGMTPAQVRERAAEFARSYAATPRQDRAALELTDAARAQLLNQIRPLPPVTTTTATAAATATSRSRSGSRRRNGNGNGSNASANAGGNSTSSSWSLPQDGATLYALSRLAEQARATDRPTNTAVAPAQSSANNTSDVATLGQTQIPPQPIATEPLWERGRQAGRCPDCGQFIGLNQDHICAINANSNLPIQTLVMSDGAGSNVLISYQSQEATSGTGSPAQAQAQRQGQRQAGAETGTPTNPNSQQPAAVFIHNFSRNDNQDRNGIRSFTYHVEGGRLEVSSRSNEWGGEWVGVDQALVNELQNSPNPLSYFEENIATRFPVGRWAINPPAIQAQLQAANNPLAAQHGVANLYVGGYPTFERPRYNLEDVRVVCEIAVGVDCEENCGVHYYAVLDPQNGSDYVVALPTDVNGLLEARVRRNDYWPSFGLDENDADYAEGNYFEMCQRLGRCPYCGQFVGELTQHQCQYVSSPNNAASPTQGRSGATPVSTNQPPISPTASGVAPTNSTTQSDLITTPQNSSQTQTQPTPVEEADPFGTLDLLRINRYDFPTSSFLSRAAYYPYNQTLDVEFDTTGAVYRYTGVPASVAEEFGQARSAGSYYSRNIRNRYPSEQLAGSDSSLLTPRTRPQTQPQPQVNPSQLQTQGQAQVAAIATASAGQTLTQSTQASQQAHSQAVVQAGQLRQSTQYSQDMRAFQAVYDAAKARKSRGEPPIPFMTENATGGLGARNGGRGFGIELEFDLDGVSDRYTALRQIGHELYQAGLTTNPNQRRYHAGSGDYSEWRFEQDETVDGEIISPILYDEPQSWEQIAKVCEIVKRHGGKATARTGGHVHVGCSDYDHTPANHNRLLTAFKENEDVLYRLAQNPAAERHRGTGWCSPNSVTTPSYSSIEEVRWHNYSHTIGLNFGGVEGTQSDHVEFRMWDGSLDPAVIQAQVNMSLALTNYAFAQGQGQSANTNSTSAPATSSQASGAGAGAGTAANREPLGTHKRANQGANGRPRRLRGAEWEADTRSFRELVDKLFDRDQIKEQLTSLFAVTKWQQG